MAALSSNHEDPLPEFLRCCDLLAGNWAPGRNELVLDLRCTFHCFDGLEPLDTKVRLRMGGVEVIEQWHRRHATEAGDRTSRIPVPTPMVVAGAWPYPSGCRLSDTVLTHGDWRPPYPVTRNELHRLGRGRSSEAEHRLVVGLVHPAFGDHDVWLVIDHHEHTVEVGGCDLSLDRWQAEFHAWLRRAAASEDTPKSSELDDIPWP